MIQTLRAMDVEDNGLIEQVGDRLDNAIAAIESLRAIIAQPDGSNRVTASVLLGEVLRKGDAKFAQFIIDKFGGKVDGLFDKYLDHYDSSFNQIDAELIGVKGELSKLRAKLNVGGEFYNEIHELFLQHDADLKAVVAKIRQDVTGYLNGFATEDLYDLDVNEMYLSVKQKLDDRFVASPLAPAVQVVMKQRLYDLDAAVREAADTEFALFDASLRTAMDELLVLLDKLFNKLLGKLQSVGGAAEVRGYAHINGDSLKLLRLDAAVQLRIPDAMEFSGYFQIKELDSDGTPTECLPASGRATEVTLGAKNIPVNYSGSTNGLKLTVGTKFTFDPGPEDAPLLVPQLVTLGGMFELNGSMTFGTLEVKYLSAGVAFGELENYITAAATIRMNGYEGTGGIFLGKTCTLGFLYWDRDVTALLGQQLPFTGVYFYGEVWVPLAQTILGIPSTCMFDISAGAGAGFGAFAEGPTFVAKMLFGLSGQISCMLDIKGTVVLAGKANPDGFALSGRGTLDVKVGPCPVCVDPSIDLFMTYQNSSWDLKF
jgi:hypothetical protein